MARKEIYHTVENKGRDKGKMFFITEMPASQAEWWAIRAGMAMAKGGVSLPENFSDLGMAGMAKVGLEMVARIPPEEARPLLDELMSCVQCVPNAADKSIKRQLVESDIEEVSTRLKIRAEVLKLHVDFLTAAAS